MPDPELPGRDHERRSQRKFQLGFGGNVQFLALGEHLTCRTGTCTDTRADSSTFSTARDGSDDRTDSGADARPLDCLSSAALSGFTVFGSAQGIGDSVDVQLREFKAKLGRSRNSTRVVGGRDAAPNVGAARRDFDAVHEQRLVQDGDECRTGFAGFAVDGVHQLDDDLGTRRDRVTRIGRCG